MNANFYTAIEAANHGRPQRALLETETGRTFTYGDLKRESARYANLLTGLGARRGDRVAVQVEKTPASLFLYLGCLRAGLIYLPLNTAYQRGELSYFLGDAEPGVIVCRPQAAELMQELCGGRSRIVTLDEDCGGTLGRAAAAASHDFATAELQPDDSAVIIYTSGTTGRSKGAVVTHRNLASNARVLVDFWKFGEDDVLLHALPMFHVHGLFVANHCALLAGAKLLWHGKFDVKLVMRDLARASVLMGVPTFYTRLLNEPAFAAGLCNDVRLFISGSAPLRLETFKDFEARTGKTILERYGMSEAGMISSNPLAGERRGGTVGFPLPGISVRIADERDLPVENGVIGAIQVKGENVFAGYWRMAENTREAFTADGYFRTGDVGVFDRDGYLSIVGRAKDLIISGGYNVYPREIELVLDTIPGVAESAVIGVPHPDFGEAVTAIVVAQKDARLDPVAVIGAVKNALANYKVPKTVHFVDDLPRNAMGKVQKALLREKFR
ncbi:MAG TPA: AMP-binding protein [Burkholderiales bacterium]|jgi:malonyl-CoA/methylmalonyl-CoA synthetase|nr:AMP-binding protein [Burkholderiales bacterium]